jgi:hypothetical protein
MGVPNPFWNAKERRLRAGWRIAITACALFLVLVLMALFRLMPAARPAGATVPATAGAHDLAWLFQMGMLALVATAIALWVPGRKLDRRPFAGYGLQLSRQWWRDLGLGLALGAALMAAVFLFEGSAGWVELGRGAPPAQAAYGVVGALLAGLAVCTLLSVAGLLLLDGWLLQNLAEGLRGLLPRGRSAIVAAWLLSSLLAGYLEHSAPHASALSNLVTVMVQLLLGLGYILAGQLGLPIGMSIAWGFLEGPVFGLPYDGENGFSALLVTRQTGPVLWTGGAFGPEGGLVTVVAVLVFAAVLAWLARARYGKLALRADLSDAPTQPSAGGR